MTNLSNLLHVLNALSAIVLIFPGIVNVPKNIHDLKPPLAIEVTARSVP